MRKAKKPQNNTSIIIAALILILVIAGLTTLFSKKDAQKNSQPEQVVLTEEDKALLADLGKIMDLPEGISPLIAKVTDPDALKEQQPGFFAKAKEGDRVVVYPTFAILYDEIENKIRHFGPVQFNNPESQVAQVNFAIYNGSGVEGAAAAAQARLQSVFNNIQVTELSNATNSYDRTLVVDLLGNNPEIQKIADSIGGVVSTLPEGEKEPEGAVVLVIVGSDIQPK